MKNDSRIKKLVLEMILTNPEATITPEEVRETLITDFGIKTYGIKSMLKKWGEEGLLKVSSVGSKLYYDLDNVPDVEEKLEDVKSGIDEVSNNIFIKGIVPKDRLKVACDILRDHNLPITPRFILVVLSITVYCLKNNTRSFTSMQIHKSSGLNVNTIRQCLTIMNKKGFLTSCLYLQKCKELMHTLADPEPQPSVKLVSKAPVKAPVKEVSSELVIDNPLEGMELPDAKVGRDVVAYIVSLQNDYATLLDKFETIEEECDYKVQQMHDTMIKRQQDNINLRSELNTFKDSCLPKEEVQTRINAELAENKRLEDIIKDLKNQNSSMQQTIAKLRKGGNVVKFSNFGDLKNHTIGL